MYDKIVFCNCNGDAIDKNVKSQTLELLSQMKPAPILLNDLCGLCASDKDLVKETFDSEGKVLVLACHPRAVKMLLNFAEITNFESFDFLNLRNDEAENSLSELKQGVAISSVHSDLDTISSKKDWTAWYPVLDYSRCTSCGQCADFCLFGVYEKIDGKVNVVNPEGCKINCPACARICPQIAIVFPKYAKGGAISGSENFSEQEEQKRQVEDMDTILGGDIYSALEQRKTKRQSIIKNEAMKKAMEERDNALNESNKP